LNNILVDQICNLQNYNRLKNYNQTQDTYSMSNSFQLKLHLQALRTLHVV